jgi:hypothetical protein
VGPTTISAKTSVQTKKGKGGSLYWFGKVGEEKCQILKMREEKLNMRELK